MNVGKLKNFPIGLKKLSDVVDNKVIRNTKFNTLKTKVNILEKKIPEATTLIQINQYNTDKQNLAKKTGNVDKKIPDTSGLVTTAVLNTKISEVENKIPNHDKYITTAEFNKLTAETFVVRLKQSYLVTKTDFDKLININRKITSNKTKHVEAEKKITYLTNKVAHISEKGYDILLGRMYFTGNDGYQNFLVFAPMLSSLILNSNRKVTN